MSENLPTPSLRERLWRIIFLSDTPAGRAFDIALLWLIAGSIAVVMAESVKEINARHHWKLDLAEYFFTGLFTIEYITRICVARRPIRYVFSFFGVVDLLSIIPTYLAVAMPGGSPEYLAVIRILRILRMFRVLKMVRHMGEARVLMIAMRASRPKITVFIFGVLTLTVIMGTLMYLLEGSRPTTHFTSIPKAIYWAIVTITTVGYGDAYPQTALGQVLAAVMMITGYAIIAVPTGIIGAELWREMRVGGRECAECGVAGHLQTANFCRDCGAKLPPETVPDLEEIPPG